MKQSHTHLWSPDLESSVLKDAAGSRKVKGSFDFLHSQLRLLGVSIEDLQKCTLRAIEAAFCSEEDKKELREKALRIMGCGE